MASFDQKDLQQTFSELQRLFNAGDYDGMRPLLHPNITWKMLHHVESISGDAAVTQWLKDGKGSLLPQFNPIPDSQINRLLADGSQQISGSASWKGDRQNVLVENIDYYFTFTTDRDDRWLLINAFGTLLLAPAVSL
jgi:hypothetical protein